MQRIDAVRAVAGAASGEELFVCALGGLWDDWWNEGPGAPENTFFPSVMGSVCSLALGLALALPERRVVALEADGSLLMSASVLCALGRERPPNLTVVVYDNASYEGTGSQPTHTAGHADLAAMAAAAGCPDCVRTEAAEQLGAEVARRLAEPGLGFVVARLEPGRHDWPPERRKHTTGVEDALRFARHVRQTTATSSASERLIGDSPLGADG
jgi:TPP-dependent trihydroxycyclohexane-1,2-dione (THcHDO) dehydratase